MPKHTPLFRSHFDCAEVTLTSWPSIRKGSLLIFYHCLLIIFTFLPNSAMSERVFALVKNMFGSDQLSTLADFLQASLMLASNGRKVG